MEELDIREFPAMSSRCTVTFFDSKPPYVIKSYLSRASYAAESEAYRRLAGAWYVPDVYEIGDNHIKMEYLDTSLNDYVKSEGHLPYDLAKQSYLAMMDMLDRGVYENADLSKFDKHYFLRNGVIKLIDFDYADIIDGEYSKRMYRDCIESEFRFLHGDDIGSEKDYRYALMCCAFGKAVCDDFFENLIRL